MSMVRQLSRYFVLLLVFGLLLSACVRPFTDGEGTSTETAEEAAPAASEEEVVAGEEETAEAPEETAGEAVVEESAETSEGEAEAEETATESEAAEETTDESSTEDQAETDEGETVVEDAAAETAAEEATSEETTSEEATSEEAESGEAVSEEAASEETEESTAAEESGEEHAMTEAEMWEDSMEVYTPTVHIVARGENLYRIGLQYGMSWVTLARYNHIRNPNRIYAGQAIRIPPVHHPMPMPEKPMEEEPMEEAPYTHYRVRPGDNLFRIGLAFGVSWVEIAEANGIMNPHQIYVGQVLKIPTTSGPMEMPDFQHTVKPGETLADIAIQYGMNQTAIAEANELTPPYALVPGQVIIIPGG